LGLGRIVIKIGENGVHNEDEAVSLGQAGQPSDSVVIFIRYGVQEIRAFPQFFGYLEAFHDPLEDRRPSQSVVFRGVGRIEGKMQEVHQPSELPSPSGIEQTIGGHAGVKSKALGLLQHFREIRMKQRFPTGEVDKSHP